MNVLHRGCRRDTHIRKNKIESLSPWMKIKWGIAKIVLKDVATLLLCMYTHTHTLYTWDVEIVDIIQCHATAATVACWFNERSANVVALFVLVLLVCSCHWFKIIAALVSQNHLFWFAQLMEIHHNNKIPPKPFTDVSKDGNEPCF